MPTIPGIRRVFRLATGRAPVADDVDAELAFHFDMAVADLVARGHTPEDARAHAEARFGNVEATRRRLRRIDARRDRARRLGEWLDGVGRDLRVAARALRRQPGFAVATALTIALGVGANAAVFSLIDAALLRTLPVRDPSALVFVETVGADGRPSGAPPYPAFARLRDATTSFAGMAAFATDELRVEIGGAPEQVMGQIASGGFFQLLGVGATLGRVTTADDERADAPVAVISHRFWRRRFGGDSAVLGTTLTHGGRSFTIVGVTPPEFWGLTPGSPIDVTLPITVARPMLTDPDARWSHAVARLRPGVSADRARAEATTVLRSYLATASSRADAPRARADRVELPPAARGMDALRRRFSKPLLALMGIVALVLLIATANITNLLLARGTARRREYAIRLATGAGAGRLARQLLTETLLLYALGVVPALLLAAWGVRAIGHLLAQGRRPIALDAAVDWRVLAFAAAVTLVAALVSGLLPAWSAVRTDPQQAIADGQGRASESRRSGAAGRTLVAAQVALSLVLLVGATAFVQSLANLRRVDLGFRADDVLTMSIAPPEGSARAAAPAEVWGRMLERVRAIPGVRRASLSRFTPLSGRDSRTIVRFPDDRVPGIDDREIRVNRVSEGYLETFGILLLRGRALHARDDASAPRVALINAAAARIFFPGRDPVGARLELGDDAASARAYQIVGVVRDGKHGSVREPAPPFVFVPIRQDGAGLGRLTLSVASAVPNERLLPAIRRAVAGVQPGVLVSEVITVRDQVDGALVTERLLSGLSSAFGGLALVVATVGLYGLLSYRVGRQRRAIGIRIALGAAPAAIARGVLRQTGAVIVAGLLVGLPLAVLAARAADSMLWGVRSDDAVTYVVAVALLALAGVAGACVPARRASSVAPAEALRPE